MNRRMFARTTFSMLAIAALAACSDDGTSVELDENGFAVWLAVDLAAMTQTASGLLYQDFSVGSGPAAQSGDFVRVRYTGWLKDGTQFDSGTFGFDLDRGQAIAGWDEGIQGMQVGGSRRLIIPPELGYGVQGSGSGRIPGNATLVFDTELLSIN